MPTTTNFGWTTPADTDLVKDGAAAIRTALGGVDTSFVDLKGGTTGQVLAKASNTDLDFTWTADSGFSNPMTTTGDTIYSSSGSTPARRAIGTTGQVLTVSGGIPVWATPAAGGKVLQVVNATYSTQVANSTSTYADTGLTATITPTSATSKVLVFVMQNGVFKSVNQAKCAIKLFRGATQIVFLTDSAGENDTTNGNDVGTVGTTYLDSPATTSATTYKTQFASQTNNALARVQNGRDVASTSTITLMEIGA
jgi:hypothetical protein